MNSLQLETMARDGKYLSPYFLGVFPSDKLPKNVPFPCALVANTMPSTHQGEHWIAIFFDQEGNAEYFCSYGVPPKAEFKPLLSEGINWTRSNRQLQGDLSLVCGQYCLAFLHFRARGVSFPVFMSLFSDPYNDEFVNAFVDGVFY